MCNCIKSAAPFKTKCFCLNRAKSALLPAFQISLYLFAFLCYTVYKVIYYGNAQQGLFYFGYASRAGRTRFLQKFPAELFSVCAGFRTGAAFAAYGKGGN